MNLKRIFSILLFLLGEALIVVCFLTFGKNLEPNVTVLNIVVSSIIYALNFIDILIPWVNFSDKSQKTIGSIGLRWFVTFIYMALAIAAMVVLNIDESAEISIQILVHICLVFLLLLGLFLAVSSSANVESVYFDEKQNRSRIDDMKKASKEVLLKVELMTNFPPEIFGKLNELHESLRFLSPSNNPDSLDLERNYIGQMKEIYNCLFDIPINFDQIKQHMSLCEQIYKERKQIFSN